ncbi:hypothetical protein Vafri_8289 [Volvox africanus]|nr:hypothetical protein Vafri_8289 [Volvox africanus]
MRIQHAQPFTLAAPRSMRHFISCPLIRNHRSNTVAATSGEQAASSSSSSSGSSKSSGASKQQAWAPPSGILKINPALLQAGGLDVSREGPQARASFEGHLTSLFVPVNLDHPGLRVLNIDPPVITVDGFMDPHECDDIIRTATESGLMRQSGLGVGGYQVKDLENVRTSSTLAATTEVLSQHQQLSSALNVMLSRARGLLRGPLPAEGHAAFSRPSQPGQVAFELPQVARYQPALPDPRGCLPDNRGGEQGLPAEGHLAGIPERLRRGRRYQVRRFGYCRTTSQGHCAAFLPRLCKRGPGQAYPPHGTRRGGGKVGHSALAELRRAHQRTAAGGRAGLCTWDQDIQRATGSQGPQAGCAAAADQHQDLRYAPLTLLPTVCHRGQPWLRNLAERYLQELLSIIMACDERSIRRALT